ncbi:ester cyclase [Alphaproteobacteria bacterium]|jgi:predicted ester cyclase|nr:ester cyclase [Alphaproteobacteria bacterium]
MSDDHQNRLRAIIAPLRAAMANFSEAGVRAALTAVFAQDALVRVCHPFGDMHGSDALYDTAFKPLFAGVPDLERRDLIVMAGKTPEGQDWIGTMGNYMGTFIRPFLDIPPTGHLMHMRYHEFFKIEGDRVTEIHAIWDIPELMMLAKAWPMAPQLGAYLCTPGPMSNDGLSMSGNGDASFEHIKDMLTDLSRHPKNPDPKIMQLDKYWHPRFNWYGPAGIGTGRGISGFRHWHQIPFLNGMPNRQSDATGNSLASDELDDLMSHWISAGSYVCETGWPNMQMKLSHDGWMGIAPANKEVTLRSVDFWRLEDGLIRENWVQIDVLNLYDQVGVDVLARMREFNKARSIGTIEMNDGLS